jgi:hypothetical protein
LLWLSLGLILPFFPVNYSRGDPVQKRYSTLRLRGAILQALRQLARVSVPIRLHLLRLHCKQVWARHIGPINRALILKNAAELAQLGADELEGTEEWAKRTTAGSKGPTQVTTENVSLPLISKKITDSGITNN